MRRWLCGRGADASVMMDENGRLPRKIGFLLLPGFSMLALFSALEPLRLTNQLLGHRYYSWRFYMPDGVPVRASCGMTVPADAGITGLSHRDDPSCLIVISGFDPWPQPDQNLKNWLRRLERRGASLGAVDTGAFLLAAADLLGNVRTVVHWESAGALLEMFPDLTLSEKPYEIQKRRYLCAGGVAVLDMMIALLQRTHGRPLAESVADRLMHVCGENRGVRAFSVAADLAPVTDPDVVKAIEIMQRRIETVSSISEIAHSINVSKRTLERKFRRLLDMTPAQAYLQCRLEHAQRLLRNTDMKIRDVALASGFASMSYFCRSYKRRFRRKPGNDRRLDYTLVESGAMLGSDTSSADAETASCAGGR